MVGCAWLVIPPHADASSSLILSPMLDDLLLGGENGSLIVCCVQTNQEECSTAISDLI